ncbi:MAG: DUF2863 family protein [Sutterella wadsworthensis]|mgnify:CR=1 FL=1|nr:DUF2863 family protein [Sutterella wadsworthensis]
MTRSASLAAQRRELSYIMHRLTSYTSLADREVLDRRLRKLLDHELNDDFYAMADDVFEKLRETHPPLADEARGFFYGMLSEVKYEYRTPTHTTTMLTVGVFLDTVFKSSAPESVLSEATAQNMVALLKKHYINPKAKITIFHEMLRSNQGPANNTELAAQLLRRMAKHESVLYSAEHLDIPESMDDPIMALEDERAYGLYLRHLVIAVTVPNDELAIVHPYHWCEVSSDPKMREEGTFDPNRITQNAWALEAEEALCANIQGFHTIVTEPFPIIRGLDFLEQVMAPFRISPLVMNAMHTANCQADELCASIAFFCSRPDAAKMYASEIRIAIGLRSERDTPFSGDCIAVQDAGADTQAVATNLERFLNMLGVTDIIFHDNARYFETEDEGGRIYVNMNGISTPLSRPGLNGAPVVPPHLLN